MWPDNLEWLLHLLSALPDEEDSDQEEDEEFLAENERVHSFLFQVFELFDLTDNLLDDNVFLLMHGEVIDFTTEYHEG